ncbi:hypothetical protein GCM10011411_05460 [Aurantiacibacter arachoides]|nr:hypothetical protein GCM10011411_05460 [Aurantiacibacter arachoides]
MTQKKQIRGSDSEQNEWVAIEAVTQPPCAASVEIFPNREGIDIAEAASIEIASSCVVQRVRTPPAIIRR